MDITFAIEAPTRLIVELRDGTEVTPVAVPDARAGVASLTRAVETAMTEGYGECFWPAVDGGHYWWMFRRRDESMEVVAMWSRGGASGWQHVFRGVDAADWICERISAEAAHVRVK